MIDTTKMMEMEESLSPIDRLIIIALKSNGKALTTYQVAKQANLAWSTANSHCYKLKSLGLVNMKTVMSSFGQKKVFWSLPE